jgi:hypothetical protein
VSYLLVTGGIACFCCGQTEPGIGLSAIGGMLWLWQKISD